MFTRKTIATSASRATSRATSPSADRDESKARGELITLLQMAYSGERAAAYAYIGHRQSLRRPKRSADRKVLTSVLVDEIQHRRSVRFMLKELGASPDRARERRMSRIGKAIGASCLVAGWFAPMYGAGRLEAQNVVEYEIAARLAHRSGLDAMADRLLELAEVEWDHELTFRTFAASHPLWKISPRWRIPGPRRQIRESFAAFVVDQEPVPSLRWTPLR